MIAVTKAIPRVLAALCPVVIASMIPTIQENRGPATASAIPTSDLPEVEQTLFTLPKPTDEQLAALMYLGDHVSAEPASTPFLRPERAPVAAPRPVAIPIEPADTVEVDQRPAVTVTSIMSGNRPIAIVNGKPLTVGKVIADDWVLVSIDAKTGCVRFEHQFDADRHFTARINRSLPGG